MNSTILSTATRCLLPLLLMFSLLLLMRGHNEPGGGFLGGLVAAAAVALFAFSSGLEAAKRMLPVRPRTLLGLGILTALGSGLVSTAQGLPFMTGTWSSQAVPVVGKLGTPLLFDVGVYLVVFGTVLTVLLELAE